jgi:hypothetical protein
VQQSQDPKRDKVQKALTEFGATVLSTMNEKGVTSQTAMLALLEKQGLKITQPGFSRWLYGEVSVRKEFPEAFSDALALSEPEKGRLAYEYAFGQTKPLKNIV